MVSSARRTGRSAASSSGDPGTPGAKPAAHSRLLRSRKDNSIASASRVTTPGPGRERPCSMKLTCRWVVSARTASLSWLSSACLPCSLEVRGELVHHVTVVPQAGRRCDSPLGIAGQSRATAHCWA